MKRFCQTVILLFVLTACQTVLIPKPPPEISSATFVGNTRVVLGDITMYFEAHGSGDPLILLHAGLGSAADWGKQIPAFSKPISNRA